MHKNLPFAGLVLIITLLFQALALPRPVAAATLCDWAQFVADVTVPDGTVFKPGEAFTKTWRMKNIGSCAWATSYNLVFVDGSQLDAPAQIALPQGVLPGQMVDLSVPMTAPNSPGTYRSNWKFKNAAGNLFGIGSTANQSFWTEIKVSATGETGVA